MKRIGKEIDGAKWKVAKRLNEHAAMSLYLGFPAGLHILGTHSQTEFGIGTGSRPIPQQT